MSLCQFHEKHVFLEARLGGIDLGEVRGLEYNKLPGSDDNSWEILPSAEGESIVAEDPHVEK